MNPPLNILLIVTVSLAMACKSSSPHNTEVPIPPALSSSASASADETAQLITTFGEHRFGNTIVEINRTERKFTVKHISSKETPGGKSTSTSAMSPPPDQWPLHDGWFAYAQQNGAYVWLHNGAGGLLLVERKESQASNATNTYGTNHFPIPIPGTVLHNLQEPLRSKLKKN
jgi:hypothetical protein